jgi:hypothetical protein
MARIENDIRTQQDETANIYKPLKDENVPVSFKNCSENRSIVSCLGIHRIDTTKIRADWLGTPKNKSQLNGVFACI